MDGKASRDKVKLIEVDEAGHLAIIPIEDLIADRMGQAFSQKPPREDMLNQAVMLYRLASEIDKAYLARRICEETLVDATLAGLESISDEGN
jgi:hypothetical protein